MSKTKRVLLLIGILIIATFLRFYHLSTTPPGLYPDEAMDGANAQNVAQTGQFKVFYPEDNGREGLYVNILAVAFKVHLLPETAPWSVRFPAAVAGVLTVWGVYLLIAELFRDDEANPKWFGIWDLKFGAYEIALLSAFFLATSFWHINFSRIGFRAILSPLCLTWAMYLLIKAFRSKDAICSLLFAIGAGVVFSAGFYTYIAYRITPLLLPLFVIPPFFKKDWRFWQRAIVFLVVAFIVGAPIGWYFVKNPADFFGRTSEISVTSASNPIHDLLVNIGKTALMFNVRGDSNWRQNVSGAPELWWPIGILFLLGIILCIWTIVARKKNPNYQVPNTKQLQNINDGNRISLGTWNFEFGIYLLGAWLILGLLPEIFSDEGIPHALRSLLAVVPVMVFAAIGAIWLYHFLQHHFGRITVNIIAIIFLVAVATYGYYDYFIVWARNPNVPGAFNADYVAIGDAINALPPATQKYVVVEAGGVIDYGIPVPATTVMYVTNSFVPDAIAQKDVNNIHYLLPDQTNTIPIGTPTDTIFFIL